MRKNYGPYTLPHGFNVTTQTPPSSTYRSMWCAHPWLLNSKPQRPSKNFSVAYYGERQTNSQDDHCSRTRHANGPPCFFLLGIVPYTARSLCLVSGEHSRRFQPPLPHTHSARHPISDVANAIGGAGTVPHLGPDGHGCNSQTSIFHGRCASSATEHPTPHGTFPDDSTLSEYAEKSIILL